jgi:hypothetical protein
MKHASKSHWHQPTAEEIIAARQAARDRQERERERMYGRITEPKAVTAESLMQQIMLDTPAAHWVSDVPCVGANDSVRATLTASIVWEERRQKCS